MGISSSPSFPRQFWVEYFSAVAALSCLAPPRFGSQSNSGLMMLPQNYVFSRIYDIVNVLESVGFDKKSQKSVYLERVCCNSSSVEGATRRRA